MGWGKTVAKNAARLLKREGGFWGYPVHENTTLQTCSQQHCKSVFPWEKSQFLPSRSVGNGYNPVGKASRYSESALFWPQSTSFCHKSCVFDLK